MSVRKSEHGFSVVEILVAIGILAVMLSLAIPSFVRAKMAANESAAIGTVKTIAQAEGIYWQLFGQGFAPNLDQLGGPAPCTLSSPANGCIIDDIISNPPYMKAGYTFRAGGGNPVNGIFTTFEINGTPGSYGQTGNRSFCDDESGVIRFQQNGNSIGIGVGSCRAVPTVPGSNNPSGPVGQ